MLIREIYTQNSLPFKKMIFLTSKKKIAIILNSRAIFTLKLVICKQACLAPLTWVFTVQSRSVSFFQDESRQPQCMSIGGLM